MITKLLVNCQVIKSILKSRCNTVQYWLTEKGIKYRRISWNSMYLRCCIKYVQVFISHEPHHNQFYYINTNEIPGELSCKNLISSCVKITCYLHMWKYHRCYGYIINRTFHTKKLLKWNGLVFHWCISARPCNILYTTLSFLQQILLLWTINREVLLKVD